jgi:aspartate/methionine/tyrosine aminotransferase
MLLAGEDTRPTPDFIKAAGQRAIQNNKTFYTPIAGYPPVRQAIANHIEYLHGVQINPANEIVVAAGGMNAIVLACQATLDPHHSAVIITPCWPNLMEAARVTGAQVIECPLTLQNHEFTLDWDRLQSALKPNTRLIALASPGNPTGWMATTNDWARLSDLAARQGAWLLADAAYDRIVFGQRVAPSPFGLPDSRPHTIHAYTFSKAYRMTGWRLGYTIAPPKLTEKMTHLQEFIVSHAPGFVQEAGKAALELGESSIARDQARYARHRQITLDALDQLPQIETPRPEGAFYAFPKFPGLADTLAFCRHLVQNYQLALAPGAAFGAGSDQHIRLCFAVEEHILRQGLQKLATAWQNDREHFLS